MAQVDWGKVNQPTTGPVFDALYDRVATHYKSAEKVYVFDGYCGAHPASRKRIRIISELAWQVWRVGKGGVGVGTSQGGVESGKQELRVWVKQELRVWVKRELPVSTPPVASSQQQPPPVFAAVVACTSTTLCATCSSGPLPRT